MGNLSQLGGVISSVNGIQNNSCGLTGNPYEDSIEGSRSQTPQQVTTDDDEQNKLSQALPFSPLEDPDLVGEAAAAKFRSQRLYMIHQQQENQSSQSQFASAITSSDPQSQLGRVYQYSSLVPPTSTSPSTSSLDERHPPTASTVVTEPAPLTERVAPNQVSEQPLATYAQHRPTWSPELDAALRAQESKTWDFMLAQMADWEERERSWKKFRDDVDKKSGIGVKTGLGWGLGFVSIGGKGKSKKVQTDHGGHGRKKRKNKVDLFGGGTPD
jgi:mannitol-1-phosphate 5-dehydrogenase